MANFKRSTIDTCVKRIYQLSISLETPNTSNVYNISQSIIQKKPEPNEIDRVIGYVRQIT